MSGDVLGRVARALHDECVLQGHAGRRPLDPAIPGVFVKVDGLVSFAALALAAGVAAAIFAGLAAGGTGP